MAESILSGDVAEILAEDAVPWRRLEGKTLLISGAGGMLAGYMVRAALSLNRGPLKSAPLRVLALVRSRERARAALGAWADEPGLEWIESDACAPLAWDGPLDFVVHAASLASPRHYAADPAGIVDVNTAGTRALLDLARRKGSEGFLFFSTSEVYGRTPERASGISEDAYGWLDPTSVRACYAESKRAGENLCAVWRHQYGVPAVIARPFHTYGPTLRLDDGRVFADFVADVVQRRDIALNSDGSARRAFCYITDATVAFYLLLLKGEAGQAYNVGNPEQEYSMLELAKTLVGLYPEFGLKVTTKAPKEGYLASKVDRSFPDVSKLKALGWEPKVGVLEGFQRVIRFHLTMK